MDFIGAERFSSRLGHHAASSLAQLGRTGSPPDKIVAVRVTGDAGCPLRHKFRSPPRCPYELIKTACDARCVNSTTFTRAGNRQGAEKILCRARRQVEIFPYRGVTAAERPRYSNCHWRAIFLANRAATGRSCATADAPLPMSRAARSHHEEWGERKRHWKLKSAEVLAMTRSFFLSSAVALVACLASARP